MPDAEHAAGSPPRTTHGARTAGHPGIAPSTAPAHRSNAGAPGDVSFGEAATRGPTQAHAGSKAQATAPNMPKHAADRGTSPGRHTRDEVCLDAIMESCRSAPNTDPTPAAPRGHSEQRDDHTRGTPLTVSRQAHPERNYAALGARAEHTAGTDDRHATASGAADQTPDEPPRYSAQGSGARVETGTNSASEPAKQPSGTTPSWSGGIQTTRAWKASPAAPAPTQNRRRPKTWTYGSTGSLQESCLLRNPANSRRGPAPWWTSPSAIRRNRTHPQPPWTTLASGTIWPPGSWRIYRPIAPTK